MDTASFVKRPATQFKRSILPFKRLLSHLLVVAAFYFLFRLCFLLFNQQGFPELGFDDALFLLVKGMRFDASALIMTNLLFILIVLQPFANFKSKAYRRFTQGIFLISNLIPFLFEISDWAYYPYNHKRSTSEVLNVVSTRSDFFNLLPSFLHDFWYVFLLALVFVLLLIESYRKIERYFNRQEALLRVIHDQKQPMAKWTYLLRFFILVLGAGLSVLGIRGGTQFVPISIRTAVSMTRSEWTPIVLNTPFSIIKSLSTARLEYVHYLPEEEAMRLVQPVKNYAVAQQPFEKRNVVFIILESFSKEFTGLNPDAQSYTPFLDSLMQEGLTFTRAYANGLHSAEGVPALVAGIPTLMDQYYTLSAYNNNRIDALPHLLNKEGYQTSFFHGGTDGTMGLDVFASAAGFQHYYGRKAYGNDKDYDGNWGIFDEPFLQFFANKLSQTPEPFMTAVFTVTSHPPYPLPKQYEGKFRGGKLPIYPTLGYSDHALRQFFEKAKQQPWFKNTLFVLSPDHCSPMASNDYYGNGNGRYEIFCTLIDPANPKLKGRDSTLLQQIDVMPTVLDYLHYNLPFYALGNSAFRKEAPRFVINVLNKTYNWIYEGQQNFIFDNRLQEAYRFPDDRYKKQDLVAQNGQEAISPESLNLFKAFVQIYNRSVIDNIMSAERFIQQKQE